MVQQAQLGMDGAATRHDAGHTGGSEGHVAQQHTRVDGPVIHTLQVVNIAWSVDQ